MSAALASWIIEKVSDENVQAEHATAEQVEQLRAELAEVKALLTEKRTP